MHDSWGKAGVRIGRGALAVERALLAELCAELEAAVREPARLATPLRVIVPSTSLRDHLSARLVAHAGRPLLGVRIQTLHAAALEILGEAAPPSGELLFSVFVQREARREEALSGPLEGLEDGYATVSASVSDLLDAGLEPDAQDPRDPWPGPDPTTPEERRAAALVRTALAVQSRMKEAGLARSGDLLRDAAQRLDRVGGEALPNRGLAIHGFADATGRALQLLEALMRSCDARIFID